MATASTERRMTLDDLFDHDGKAELIGGRIVPQMATGYRPNVIAGRIFRRLADFVDDLRQGTAFTDNMGFAVDEMTSGRESFSPDVAFYDGPLPTNLMRFVVGSPSFAVEVRSESDYGPAAEREMAAKRADYFEAGTRVIWDVDPLAGCVRVYRPDAPEAPTVCNAGQEADAEPAVPGWRLAVDRIFV